MRKLHFFLTSLALLGSISAAPRDADSPAPLTAEKEWKGSVEDATLLQNPPDTISSTEAWKKQWAAWKLTGEAPDIDFTKSLVVLSTGTGSRLNMSVFLSAAGDVEIRAISTRDLVPGFRYAFAQISAKGVKSVNGKPLGKK
jgi:hypothetical protein